jgi:hypothetical protein
MILECPILSEAEGWVLKIWAPRSEWIQLANSQRVLRKLPKIPFSGNYPGATKLDSLSTPSSGIGSCTSTGNASTSTKGACSMAMKITFYGTRLFFRNRARGERACL